MVVRAWFFRSMKLVFRAFKCHSHDAWWCLMSKFEYDHEKRVENSRMKWWEDFIFSIMFSFDIFVGKFESNQKCYFENTTLNEIWVWGMKAFVVSFSWDTNIARRALPVGILLYSHLALRWTLTYPIAIIINFLCITSRPDSTFPNKCSLLLLQHFGLFIIGM